jgi:hypothetical protein
MVHVGRFFVVVAAYLIVAATLLAASGSGLALAVIATSRLFAELEERTPTVLDLQVKTSREIREALAKPIPRPDPLLPITAKVERPLTAKVERPQGKVTVAAAKSDRLKVLKPAQDAFASLNLVSQAPSYAMAFDRHGAR